MMGFSSSKKTSSRFLGTVFCLQGVFIKGNLDFWQLSTQAALLAVLLQLFAAGLAALHAGSGFFSFFRWFGQALRVLCSVYFQYFAALAALLTHSGCSSCRFGQLFMPLNFHRA